MVTAYIPYVWGVQFNACLTTCHSCPMQQPLSTEVIRYMYWQAVVLKVSNLHKSHTHAHINHWKMRVVMMPTLSSLVALQVGIMITCSVGIIFRCRQWWKLDDIIKWKHFRCVTGHLCGDFTRYRWIPRTKASDAKLWCFLWLSKHLEHRSFEMPSLSLWCHCNGYPCSWGWKNFKIHQV